ncbi:MAG: cob(I)yrinic acid a,c-diamide adenosyltransferase [Candidatus Magnetominusculus sp. LBB02]|nr:cob(I)yrinic acid a,c-diamide adenosyltransferase [Candidatus Magnetominusculus sp. LBB02]
MLTEGLVQVYTGNGKGKTTAAVGLSVRALGAGLRVFFAQFIKMRESSEFAALAAFEGRFCLRRFGRGFVQKPPAQDDIDAARAGLAESTEAIFSQSYDIVVLDEINVAVNLGLIALEDIVQLIKDRPKAVELILTGRGAPHELIDAADLVTALQEVKHYYNNGIKARKGIEF